MNRRETITALFALGAAAPFATRAQSRQSARVRTIGYLGLESAPSPPADKQPMSVALRKLGWIEGQNLVVERRFAEFNAARLPGFAEELVRAPVELIVTNGPAATLAAARATNTIPIVFYEVVWPLEQGLIDSFARPGRNLTGMSFYTGVEVSNKRLEFLREIAPAAKRLYWLWPTEFQETVSGGRFDMAPQLEAGARSVGFEPRLHPVRKVEDIEPALSAALAWGAQAISASGPYVYAERQRIAEFTLRHRLPSAFISVANVEAGGLLSYAPPATERMTMVSRSMGYVDRILRGARPADMPVEQPSTYELVINLKTAKALGLAVPQSLRLRAHRLIE